MIPWAVLIGGIVTTIIATVAGLVRNVLDRTGGPSEPTAKTIEDWLRLLIEWIFGKVEWGHTVGAAGFRSLVAEAGANGVSAASLPAVKRYHDSLEDLAVQLWHERVTSNHHARSFPMPDTVRDQLARDVKESEVRARLRALAAERKSPKPVPFEKLAPYVMLASDEEEKKLIEATGGSEPVGTTDEAEAKLGSAGDAAAKRGATEEPQ